MDERSEVGGRRSEVGGVDAVLKVCPFCGAENVDCKPAIDYDAGMASHCVCCCVCWAHTHFFDTEAEAREAWNKRAAGEKDSVCCTDLHVLFEGGLHLTFAGKTWVPQSERSEFAEIVERLKQRGVIPMEFDAGKLDADVARGDAESAEVAHG